MKLLHDFGIICLVFIILTMISLKTAWTFRIRQWYQLLLVCSLTGAGMGIVLSVMSKMMAASRFPGVALFIGAIMGMTFGLITGGLCLSIAYVLKGKNKSETEKV